MTQSTDDLEATLSNLIETGTTDDIRKFLSAPDSRENRAKLAAVARKWYKVADEGKLIHQTETSMTWQRTYPDNVSENAFESLVLTATPGDFKNTKWNAGRRAELTLDLAKCLQPDCLIACIDSLLADTSGIYHAVRAIISSGLCPRPQTENFAISIIAINAHFKDLDTVFYELRLDPKTLEEDIWLLFETEGTTEISLAAIDKYSRPGSTWSIVLYRLQKEGSISRERLLKASLSALNRGFIQFRAGWFSRFHESLEPTDDERLKLVDDYGRLLSSSIQPTASFALSAWLKIDKIQPISGEKLSLYLLPCLTSPTKGTVVSALSLIEKACKRDASFMRQGITLVLEALNHESNEVQSNVLKFLQSQKTALDDDIKKAIEERLETITPALQAGFKELIGKVNTAKKTIVKELYHTSESAWQDYNRGTPFYAIENAQDFIEQSLVIAETMFSPPAAECLMIAVATGKVEDLRNIAVTKSDSLLAKSVKPLIARLIKLNKDKDNEWDRTPSFFLRQFLLNFFGVQGYCDFFEKVLSEPTGINQSTRLFAERLSAILKRSSNGIFATPGFPSWDGGYISSEDFLKQAEEMSIADCHFEQCEPYLAVVRLPWVEQEKLFHLLQSKRYKGQYVAYCLKVLAEIISVKSRFTAEKPFARDKSVIKEIEKSDDYLLAFMARCPIIKSIDVEVLQLSYYNFPIFCEGFHGEGAARLKQTVRYSDVSDLCNVIYFFPMSVGIVPMKDRAHFLLAVGCLLAIPEIATMVFDCLLFNIEERRLNTEAFGQYLGLLLHSEISMPKRMAGILGRTAQISDIHNDAVRQALETSLARNPADSPLGTPRDIGAILEVLQTCAIRAGQTIKNETARSYLLSLKSTGKAGKLAKELLALG